MKLMIIAGLVAAASACCMPPMWTAKLGLQYAMYNEKTQNGTYIEGSVEVFFDAKRKMIAENQMLNIDSVGVQQRLVLDFSQGISFLINQDSSSCSKHMLPKTWELDCLPANATDANTPYNYGFGDNTVKTNLYSWKMGNTDVYMTVTADTCVPVAEDTFTRMDSVAVMQTMSYSNVVASISDPQAFYVPISCTKNTPILPPLPGTGSYVKRSLNF